MSDRAHSEPLRWLAVPLFHGQGAAAAYLAAHGAVTAGRRGAMEHSRMVLSLAVVATALPATACSDGPTAPAPVYLMGQTSGRPGGRAVVGTPLPPPRHSQIVEAVRFPPMMEPRSPSQHQSSGRATGEKRMTFAQKNHGHQVAAQPAARRRTYHAVHASSVAAASSSPEQIPLDAPVMAPAPPAAAPAAVAQPLGSQPHPGYHRRQPRIRRRNSGRRRLKRARGAGAMSLGLLGEGVASVGAASSLTGARGRDVRVGNPVH